MKFVDGLVSVVVPTYNSEQFIEETINCVLNQTYKNIEIIIVDDNSSDNTIEIVNSFARKHSNIVLLQNEINSGAGYSRNRAIKTGKGRYVAFLDSDDKWDSTKIEKQLLDLAETKGGFSFTAIEMIDQQGKIVKTKRKIKRKVSYKYLLKNTVIATSSVILDRFIIGDFEMSQRRGGQDYATWLNMLKICQYAYGIDEPLCKYRVGRKNSLAGNKWKSIKQVWQIQRRDQHICVFSVFINLICFIFNGLKKYLM